MIKRDLPDRKQSEKYCNLFTKFTLVSILIQLFRTSNWNIRNNKAREDRGDICIILLWILLVVLLVLFMATLILLALDYVSGFF